MLVSSAPVPSNVLRVLERYGLNCLAKAAFSEAFVLVLATLAYSNGSRTTERDDSKCIHLPNTVARIIGSIPHFCVRVPERSFKAGITCGLFRSVQPYQVPERRAGEVYLSLTLDMWHVGRRDGDHCI